MLPRRSPIQQASPATRTLPTIQPATRPRFCPPRTWRSPRATRATLPRDSREPIPLRSAMWAARRPAAPLPSLTTLPAGLVPTTASGTGWTCSIAGQGVSCNRSDPLAPGQSYPAITLTVSVQRNAPASVTNTAVVFGGGEVNPSNNTATDPTTITAGPNLTITKSHTGNFTQGQTGTYTLTVSNTGASPTSGPIAVTDSLPSGLASTAATGTGWSCTPGGQSVTCTRSDPLAPGASYPPITLTVEVAANAPASVTNTAMVAGGGDVDSSNNSASDPTTIIAVPDLTITKTHTGSFLQGQVGATYTLTVTNIGGGPTSSPVTVSDTLPAGLTPTAAAGAGWVCQHRRPGCELHARRRAQCGSQLSGHYPHGERGAGGPAIVDEHGDGLRRGRDQYGQQHGQRYHHDRARPRPDHQQEPLGQLPPGTDRGDLHHHGQQPRLSADHRRRDGHRQRSRRTGPDIRSGCRLDL